MQARLAQGWTTWNTHTVTSAVLLPAGLEVRLGLGQNNTKNRNAFLPMVLIGRKGEGEERVHPGAHGYDGSYSDLTMEWHGYTVRVEMGHSGADEVMLVTPVGKPQGLSQPLSAVFSVGMLWGRAGRVEMREGAVVASVGGALVHVFAVGHRLADPQVPVAGPYLVEVLEGL